MLYSRQLVSGRRISGSSYPEYELVVEYSWLFGLFKRRQAYRGNYAWKLYPQGSDADAAFVQPWLEAQLQQHKWGLT